MPPTSIVRKAFLKLGLIFLFLHHSVIGFDEISLNEFEQPEFRCAGQSDDELRCSSGLCYDYINVKTEDIETGCANENICKNAGCALHEDTNLFTCCCANSFCNGKSQRMVKARWRMFQNGDYRPKKWEARPDYEDGDQRLLVPRRWLSTRNVAINKSNESTLAGKPRDQESAEPLHSSAAGSSEAKVTSTVGPMNANPPTIKTAAHTSLSSTAKVTLRPVPKLPTVRAKSTTLRARANGTITTRRPVMIVTRRGDAYNSSTQNFRTTTAKPTVAMISEYVTKPTTTTVKKTTKSGSKTTKLQSAERPTTKNMKKLTTTKPPSTAGASKGELKKEEKQVTQKIMKTETVVKPVASTKRMPPIVKPTVPSANKLKPSSTPPMTSSTASAVPVTVTADPSTTPQPKKDSGGEIKTMGAGAAVAAVAAAAGAAAVAASQDDPSLFDISTSTLLTSLGSDSTRIADRTTRSPTSSPHDQYEEAQRSYPWYFVAFLGCTVAAILFALIYTMVMRRRRAADQMRGRRMRNDGTEDADNLVVKCAPTGEDAEGCNGGVKPTAALISATASQSGGNGTAKRRSLLTFPTPKFGGFGRGGGSDKFAGSGFSLLKSNRNNTTNDSLASHCTTVTTASSTSAATSSNNPNNSALEDKSSPSPSGKPASKKSTPIISKSGRKGDADEGRELTVIDPLLNKQWTGTIHISTAPSGKK